MLLPRRCDRARRPTPVCAPRGRPAAATALGRRKRSGSRIRQADIPNLPALLAAFPFDAWHRLRRNLACVWPRVLWLPSDNEAPGIQLDAAASRSAATDMLGDQAFLRNYDAWTSLMTTLARRAARRRNETVPPFEWRTPARSCQLAAS